MIWLAGEMMRDKDLQLDQKRTWLTLMLPADTWSWVEELFWATESKLVGLHYIVYSAQMGLQWGCGLPSLHCFLPSPVATPIPQFTWHLTLFTWPDVSRIGDKTFLSKSFVQSKVWWVAGIFADCFYFFNQTLFHQQGQRFSSDNIFKRGVNIWISWYEREFAKVWQAFLVVFFALSDINKRC